MYASDTMIRRHSPIVIHFFRTKTLSLNSECLGLKVPPIHIYIYIYICRGAFGPKHTTKWYMDPDGKPLGLG